MIDKPKSYWRVARVAFMALGLWCVLVIDQPVMAAVWLACSLVCHATRTILDSVEGLSTPSQTEGE